MIPNTAKRADDESERAAPLSDLVCPACHGELESQAAGVRCRECAHLYARRDGFLDLVVGERFDDPSDDELLRYEEQSNRDLALNYWIPLFRRLGDGRSELRVLSVGCGTGVDVETLHEAGFDSMGIDCGNRAKTWPRRGIADRLLMANGKHLPFRDASFDVVFCGCVFPHVGVVGDTSHVAPDCTAQRTQLALEMSRVLRPGGHVIVASPNRWFPLDIFHGRGAGCYTPRGNWPGDRFLLSRNDYDKLFRGAGCGRAAALPVNGYWGFIRSRKSVKGYLLGLPVRFVLWLVSRRALAFLRASPINPWLVVAARKRA